VIAHEIGYRSAFHFSNVFTKWVGVRPSEYREGSAGEDESEWGVSRRQAPAGFFAVSISGKADPVLG
jgi:AraC-like DNA-binding protein